MAEAQLTLVKVELQRRQVEVPAPEPEEAFSFRDVNVQGLGQPQTQPQGMYQGQQGAYYGDPTNPSPLGSSQPPQYHYKTQPGGVYDAQHPEIGITPKPVPVDYDPADGPLVGLAAQQQYAAQAAQMQTGIGSNVPRGPRIPQVDQGFARQFGVAQRASAFETRDVYVLTFEAVPATDASAGLTFAGQPLIFETTDRATVREYPLGQDYVMDIGPGGGGTIRALYPGDPPSPKPPTPPTGKAGATTEPTTGKTDK